MGIMIATASQFYDQLEAGLRAKLVDSIPVAGYDDIDRPEIKGPTVLIQLEDAHPGRRSPSGRYCHTQMITAHCVVPSSLPRAVLVATDLAYEVERIVDLNNWGISPECCGQPDIQVNGDTSFLFGWDGVEARGVQWQQNIYLGADYFDADEERAGIRLAVNPKHPDKPGEYHPFPPDRGEEG
ncbi:hypothetical protein ABKS78_23990 [Enterobacter cloacae]|jgi:hypothetical protein|uniref:hypothetical protein n=2 Tax=Enterobacter hormaechei TaxID=158836 RepID=UPI00079B19C8|nr:hypothetical protein [Enterobacter hormaechei]SAB22895.1 Uncharacterised protein [Enterobacter hormaechei]SAI44003.1 Uncharacterised protein [Enterobacter hormaechei]